MLINIQDEAVQQAIRNSITKIIDTSIKQIIYDATEQFYKKELDNATKERIIQTATEHVKNSRYSWAANSGNSEAFQEIIKAHVERIFADSGLQSEMERRIDRRLDSFISGYVSKVFDAYMQKPEQQALLNKVMTDAVSRLILGRLVNNNTMPTFNNVSEKQ